MTEEGMEKEKLTYKWTHKKVTITKDNIGDFEILGNRRDIRPGHVRRLWRLLTSGGHFESGFVVSKRGTKMRLLDGNHRLEAIKRLLQDNPGWSVDVSLQIYEGLSDEDEREIYRAWNMGARQSTNDFITQYWKSVPLFKKLQKSAGFPIDTGVHWSTNTMEARHLLSGYFAAKDFDHYSGPFTGTGEQFIERCKMCKAEDVARLKAFMLDYVSIFGNPDKKSHYYRPAVFFSVIDIWLRNHKNVPSVPMEKKLRTLLGNPYVVKWASGTASLANCILARRDIVDVMNRVQPKYKVE